MCSVIARLFVCLFVFFFSSRRRHTRSLCDWSSDVCSSDLSIFFPSADTPLGNMTTSPMFLAALITIFVVLIMVVARSEEHTSELQSHSDLVCGLLLEKKKKQTQT